MAYVWPGGGIYLHADRLAKVGRLASDSGELGGDRRQRYHDAGERADASRGVPRAADCAVPRESASSTVPVQATEVRCGVVRYVIVIL